MPSAKVVTNIVIWTEIPCEKINLTYLHKFFRLLWRPTKWYFEWFMNYNNIFFSFSEFIVKGSIFSTEVVLDVFFSIFVVLEIELEKIKSYK